MLHRSLRYNAGWEWHLLLRSGDNNPIQELKNSIPACAGWLDKCEERARNHIAVIELIDGQPVLHGTLMFQVSEEEGDIQPFHYWMTPEMLVTIHSDMRLPVRLQRSPWEEMLARCLNAPEAFSVILSSVLESLLTGLDAFERNLRKLEQKMRAHGRNVPVEAIIDLRYDLLHWNHQFVSVKEIEGAAKEAFNREICGKEGYERYKHKLQRIDTMLRAYNEEIETLTSMDEMQSGFHGNDLLKTLTIIIALFTPATVAGMLWGLNFERLPWLEEPWGFALLCGIILLFTMMVYAWLWRKSWVKVSSAEKSRKRKTAQGSQRSRRRPAAADASASLSVEPVTLTRSKAKRQAAKADVAGKSDDRVSR
ncbi:CorA family divalent cation transporter [Paenibacillus tarimensis]